MYTIVAYCSFPQPSIVCGKFDTSVRFDYAAATNTYSREDYVALSNETQNLALTEITETLTERGADNAEKQASTDFGDRLRRARKMQERWQRVRAEAKITSYLDIFKENHRKNLQALFRAEPGVSKETAKLVVRELMGEP
jgi:hypothetical protein